MTNQHENCDYLTYVSRFQRKVSDLTHTGTIGLGEDAQYAKYVCKAELQKYWSIPRINEILSDLPECKDITAKEIKTEYLITFSILCYITKPDNLAVQYIGEFVQYRRFDLSLPFSKWVHGKPPSPGLKDTLDLFLSDQWMFIPYEFADMVKCRRRMHHKTILPFSHSDLVPMSDSKSASQVYSVKVMRCCTRVKKNTVILKLVDHKSRIEWDREVTIYTKLSSSFDPEVNSNPFQYIVEYFGSFSQLLGEPNDSETESQSESYGIILEHMSGGSLETLFRNREDLTKSAQDRQNLWQHMFDLLQGIHLLHNLEGGWRATHQDINKENVLHTDDPSRDLSDACFKLVDFGRAQLFKPDGRKDQAAASSHTGTRAYMAPEVCKILDVEYQVMPKFNPEADIWALGCLFSDILIWTALGHEGVTTYRDKRMRENQRNNDIIKVGYEGCFHNGVSRLEAVSKMHDTALSKFDPDDCSHHASKIILDSMLQVVESRERDLTTLRKIWGQKPPVPSFTPSSTIVKRTIEYVAETEPTPDQQASLPVLRRAGSLTNPFGKAVTITEIIRHMDANRGHVAEDQFETVREAVRMLAGTSRSGRSQMFLVDDSDSMKAHQTNAAIAVRVLSKLVKGILPQRGKMTLDFASDKKQVSGVKSSRLAQSVREHKFHNHLQLLGQDVVLKLGNIFRDIRQEIDKNHLNPRSIYVLTDGLWIMQGRERDIQTPIMNLMDKMLAARVDMKDISITIIRFTPDDPEKSSPEGTSYIDFNDLVIQLRAHQGMSSNLVTVCRFDNGDVHQMLMGRVSEGSIKHLKGGDGKLQTHSQQQEPVDVQKPPGPPGPPGPPPSN